MSKKFVDITPEVSFDLPDGEALPLLKCKCGQKFQNWDFILSMKYEDRFKKCPNCGRELCWEISVCVYEVRE